MFCRAQDLNLACEQWACESLRKFIEEMELWKWDLTLGNRCKMGPSSKVLAPAQHSGCNRRGSHRGWGAARYELGEGNARAKPSD